MINLSEPPTAWQRTWRQGIAPQLSTEGLLALKRALERDDPMLTQGATTQPRSLQAVQAWPVEAACAVCYAGWQGEGLQTVAEAEQFFARVCYEADEVLGEPSAARYFVNWFDETPRDEMRTLLLEEVERTLAERAARAKGGQPQPCPRPSM